MVAATIRTVFVQPDAKNAREHWRQILPTNPLERLNKEVKRRIDVVGIFPNDKAVVRLVGALLSEQNDVWQVGLRYFSGKSMAKLTGGKAEERTPVLLQVS